MDKRHKQRILIVQNLFSALYDNAASRKMLPTVIKILNNVKEIDKRIAIAAPKYEVGKIAKVDLSILRLAIYELTIEKKQPPKVIINEAIELAKELASEKSPAFVNAVLGKIFEMDKKMYI